MARKKKDGDQTPSQELAEIRKALLSSKKIPGAFAKDLNIPVRYLKTGSLYLDYVTGGGFQYGRVHEIAGDESSGKTTALLGLVRYAQANGEMVGWIDSEYSWDNEYAELKGIDLDQVFVVREHRIEPVIEAIREMLKAGVKVIIIDSVADLRGRKEIEDDPKVAKIGGNAKELSRLCYAVAGDVAVNDAILLGINQVRYNMGRFVNPHDAYKTPGGKKWQHTIASSIQFIRSSDIRDDSYNDSQGSAPDVKTGTASDQLNTGHNTWAYSRKNKLGNVRGRRRRLWFDNLAGLDVAMEITEVAITRGLIKKKGRTFYFENERGEEDKVVGQDNLTARLREDMDLFDYYFEKCEKAIQEEIEERDRKRLEQLNGQTLVEESGEGDDEALTEIEDLIA
jgi:RecA/RadA recombinase